MLEHGVRHRWAEDGGVDRLGDGTVRTVDEAVDAEAADRAIERTRARRRHVVEGERVLERAGGPAARGEPLRLQRRPAGQHRPDDAQARMGRATPRDERVPRLARVGDVARERRPPRGRRRLVGRARPRRRPGMDEERRAAPLEPREDRLQPGSAVAAGERRGRQRDADRPGVEQGIDGGRRGPRQRRRAPEDERLTELEDPGVEGREQGAPPRRAAAPRCRAGSTGRPRPRRRRRARPAPRGGPGRGPGGRPRTPAPTPARPASGRSHRGAFAALGAGSPGGRSATRARGAGAGRIAAREQEDRQLV